MEVDNVGMRKFQIFVVFMCACILQLSVNCCQRCSSEFPGRRVSMKIVRFGYVWERRKRVTSAAKAFIYNVCRYFERQASKSKCRGLPQVTCKTTKATRYTERTVRCIMGEKHRYVELRLHYQQSGIN